MLYKRVSADYQREQDRADRLEKELRELNQATQKLIETALRDATNAVADAIEVIGPAHRPRRG